MTHVRAAAWDQLEAICEALPERPRAMHTRRMHYQDQLHGMYLIGWSDEVPVGHLLLKWPGWPERPWSMELQGAYGCSIVEDLWVKPESRGLGTGRALMEIAHSHTIERGISSVGLSVGLTQGYEAAQHLYRSLGYRDQGHGHFVESSPGWWDILIFLLNRLT